MKRLNIGVGQISTSISLGSLYNSPIFNLILVILMIIIILVTLMIIILQATFFKQLESSRVGCLVFVYWICGWRVGI